MYVLLSLEQQSSGEQHDITWCGSSTCTVVWKSVHSCRMDTLAAYLCRDCARVSPYWQTSRTSWCSPLADTCNNTITTNNTIATYVTRHKRPLPIIRKFANSQTVPFKSKLLKQDCEDKYLNFLYWSPCVFMCASRLFCVLKAAEQTSHTKLCGRVCRRKCCFKLYTVEYSLPQLSTGHYENTLSNKIKCDTSNCMYVWWWKWRN